MALKAAEPIHDLFYRAMTLALPIACFESVSAMGELDLYKQLVRQIAYSTRAFVGWSCRSH